MRESVRTYRKPDFTMMRFTMSDNVAGCPTTDTYNSVTVSCLITGTHEIFYTGCENNYSELTIVEITSDVYLQNSNQAIEYLSDLTDGTLDGTYQAGSYTLYAGEYLVWTTTSTTGGGHGSSGGSQTTTHAGLITADITSVVNSSK